MPSKGRKRKQRPTCDVKKTCKLTEYFDIHGDGAMTVEAGNIGTTSTSVAEGIQQKPTPIKCNRTSEKNKNSNDIETYKQAMCKPLVMLFRKQRKAILFPMQGYDFRMFIIV